MRYLSQSPSLKTKLISEFSRLISIGDIGKDGMQINVAASDVECEALAKRFSVERLEELKAHLRFYQSRRRGVTHLEAHFSAKVVQMCIVTLEPISKYVEGEFSCTFANFDVTDKEAVVEFDLEDKDPPEILNEGIFDVGELLAEHLCSPA